MSHVETVIAIDFDGTIAKHRYPNIGEPVPGAFEWMKKFQEAGAKLVLYTMRSDDSPDPALRGTLTDAVEFCRGYGIEFWGVNTNPEQREWTYSPKTWAHVYIDDHGVFCPLIYPSYADERPYVNWQLVGPEVMKYIAIRTNRKWQKN
jgi:hypothetical protein